MLEEYNLEAIEYESWDDAFDAYNKVKDSHPGLSFHIWYEQQISWLAFQEYKEEEEERLLREQLEYESQSLVKILTHIFQQYNLHTEELAEDEEDDEWDPWDEDNELNNEDEDFRPF